MTLGGSADRPVCLAGPEERPDAVGPAPPFAQRVVAPSGLASPTFTVCPSGTICAGSETLHERLDQRCDHGYFLFEREVACLEKINLRLGNVAPVGVGPVRSEERVVAPLPSDEVEGLNGYVGDAMGRLVLRRGDDGALWAGQDEELQGILWPVIRAAADLLVSGDLAQLKFCAGEECQWLFIEQSRNQSRRWCDMRGCGNVAKVRRFRRRHSDDGS